MFSLPVDFVTDMTANATSAISSLSPYITLILGVLLAVLVISVLIRAISK
jgi:hypothetical protein